MPDEACAGSGQWAANMIEAGGPRTLPLSNREAHDIFHTPDGAEHDGLTVDRSNYYWSAVWACLSTIIEAGLRGGEVYRGMPAA